MSGRAQHDADRRPRVRFLLHGAERSGPPIYLLRLLEQWQREDPGFERDVVLARPGPLLPAFSAAATTDAVRLDHHSPERLAERALRGVGLASAGTAMVDLAVRARSRTYEPDLTVVNGATQPTAELLRALRPTGEVRLIAHELSTGWCSNIDVAARRLLLDRVDSYLAVSRCVAEYLSCELDVAEDRITVVRPPAGRWPFLGRSPYTEGVPSGGAVVVGGAGVHDWRKAPELWLQLAARVRDRLGDDRVRFVWFGGHESGSLPSWPIRHELHHLGLEGHVDFVGEVADLPSRLREVDLFVSTAREDAYPLVCAEACAAGVPVLTFDGGGAAELVADSGCGESFAYPDLDAMAERIGTLTADVDERRTLGNRGQSWAAEHLAESAVAPKVANWILTGGPA